MSDTFIAGSLPVNSTVDPNGSLAIQVPIRVPPAKLSPDLSISYHSAVHEMTVLGHGWELDAFSLIQRTAATVVQDGFAGSVNYDSNDRFTLNGQRLMHISGNEFRYEIEQWSKVVAVGSDLANPESWIEYLPNGNVRLYGSTTDSNLPAQGQSATRIWALSETYDKFSNYTSYTYSSTNDFITVTAISYGGNKSLNMAHQRVLSFEYTDRRDVQTEFVGGSSVTLDKRLASISASFNGAIVHKHTFDYDYAPVTEFSRLLGVTLSDSSGSSVSPLTFNWSNAPSSVFDNLTTLKPLTPEVATAQVFPVDVGGSGKTDIILASSQYDSNLGGQALCLDVHLADGSGGISTAVQEGSGSTGLLYPTQLLALDTTGNGKTDLLHIFQSGTVHELTVLLSTEKGYVPQKTTTFSPDVSSGRYYTGDFEGNGDVGLVYIYNEIGSGGSLAVRFVQFISDGNGSFTAQPIANGPDFVDLSGVQVVIADFNGNGASDIFLISSMFSGSSNVCEIDFIESKNGLLEFRSDGPFIDVGTQIQWTQTTSFLALPEQDGKTGLLLLSQSMNSFLQFMTLRSTGKTLALSELVTTSLLYSGNINLGRSTSVSSLDLVNTFETVNGTEIAVLHFFNGTFVNITGVKQPPGTSVSGFRVDFADLRGIGRADCLFSLYDHSAGELILHSLPCAGSVEAPADFITSYTNGLGGTTSISYAPLTDSTVYTASPDDPSAAAPYVNALSRTSSWNAVLSPSTGASSDVTGGRTRSQLIHFPKYVVKEMTSCALPSVFPDVVSKTTYFFTNGRMAFDGRGWLGFETIVQGQEVLGTSTTNTYIQQFPFIGQTSKMETREGEPTSPGDLVKSVTYSWDSHAANGGVNCYTTVSSTHQDFYESGKPSYSVDVASVYDSYANLTQTTITTPGKPSLEIASEYSNDTSNWVIGAKLSESVTSDGTLMRQRKFQYVTGTEIANQVGDWVSGSLWSLQDLSFDTAGNVTSAVGPQLAQRDLGYDSTYTFPTSVEAVVDDQTTLTTTASYDYGVGQAISVTDYNGHVKTQKYDVLGRVIEVSEVDGSVSTTVDKREYTLLDNQPVCIRDILCDASSGSWAREITYLDGMEREWKKAIPSPSDPSVMVYTQVLYDGAGRAIRQYRNYTSDTANPVYASYEYDSSSRKIKSVSPPATSEYDPVTIVYTYTYDGQTTITETKSGGGEEESTAIKTVLEYFPNPDLGSHKLVLPLAVCSVNELGQSIFTSFDALHRAIRVTDPSGVCLLQTWDGTSRQTSRKISNPEGTSPDLISHLSIAYDDTAGLTTITNELTESSTVLQKDRLHRPTKRTTPEETLSFLYDKGLLSTVTSSKDIEETFTYDSRGCMQSSSLAIDDQAFTTSFEYTTNRQLSQITNPDGSVLTKTFFANSDVVNKVLLTNGDTTSVSATFGDVDDAFLLPLTCEFGNGLKSSVTLADNGVPLKAVLLKGSSTVHQQTWKLNGFGRIDNYNPSLSEGNERVFEYNPAGHLIRAQIPGEAQGSYDYDQCGNIASKDGNSYVNQGWQLASINDSSTGTLRRSFTYSPDGHLTTEKNGDGTTVRTMAYDSDGRMTSLNGAGFVYNFKGRIIKATSSSDGSVTYYPSESYEVTIGADEKNKTETRTSYLVHQRRRASITTIVDASSSEKASSSVHYYHNDHLGSIVAVSDDTGEIVTNYSYDAFGTVTVDGPDISRYKYGGKEMFDGMYYFGARFYDPSTGRFTTLDTITFSLSNVTPSTFNQYTFSRNDPINFVDSNGNLSFWWHLAWHLAVDALLIAAGVAAMFLLPEVPIVADMLLGAGINGLIYDGQAAFNAVAYDQKEINDAAWGVALGVGALFSVTGAAGSALASKAGFAAIEAVDLLGTRVAGKFVQSEVLALAKRGAVQLAVSAINGAASGATQQVLTNVVTGKDPGEGVGMAALISGGTGLASGVFGGVLQGAKAIRSGKTFFYNVMRDANSVPRALESEIKGVQLLSYRFLDQTDKAVERSLNLSSSSNARSASQSFQVQADRYTDLLLSGESNLF
ncbi:hypothetical protein VKT23_012067 [Stygiomarasmius scandens]|uniref:Teneurin-like YD-shell domain-containing protein n=1 Tax=Marasmiellus scandens TaxID=2682957 RepID=A0ABR1J6U9_9AGAR